VSRLGRKEPHSPVTNGRLFLEHQNQNASQPVVDKLWRALLLPTGDLLGECRREAYQGSGAGGQKRNRVRSGIRLIHDATGLRAENCEHREAGHNVQEALHHLRLQCALALGEWWKAADPNLAANLIWPEPARSRFRVEASPSHADYPIAAACSLVALARAGGRLSEAAEAVGVSGSALTRHFKADKAIWAFVLRLRQANQMPPLK
jgi:RF-1 domain